MIAMTLEDISSTKFYRALSPKQQQIFTSVFADGLDLVGAIQKVEPSLELDRAKLAARRLLLENPAFQNVLAFYTLGFDLSDSRDIPEFPGTRIR
jgi:hypothetical protein